MKTTRMFSTIGLCLLLGLLPGLSPAGGVLSSSAAGRMEPAADGTAWSPQTLPLPFDAPAAAFPNVTGAGAVWPAARWTATMASLPPLENVLAIAAGGAHTCALTTGGGVKCWGANRSGQVGDGTLADRTTPVDVVGLGSGVASIAAGWYHTCARTTGGGARCWGWDGYGQLGLGTIIYRTTPVDVVTLIKVYLPLVLRGY